MVICVFGDSIAWGAFDYKNGGWANQLRNFFEKQDKDVEVYNLSIAGNTTQDLINRFENEVKNRNPNTVILAIGINDIETDNLVFEKNIKKLYKIARKYTKKIIFVGLTRVDEKRINKLALFVGKKYSNQKIDELDQIIQKICTKNNLKYIKIGYLLENSDLVDGLHPNTKGHEKMFVKIKKELDE